MHKLNKMLASAAVTLLPVLALAQTADPKTTLVGSVGWVAIAAGLAIGLAAIGGTLAQGKAASAALDGMARNPGAAGKVFVPMILSLAFIESLVIFSFLISNSMKGVVVEVFTALGH